MFKVRPILGKNVKASQETDFNADLNWTYGVPGQWGHGKVMYLGLLLCLSFNKPSLCL